MLIANIVFTIKVKENSIFMDAVKIPAGIKKSGLMQSFQIESNAHENGTETGCILDSIKEYRDDLHQLAI